MAIRELAQEMDALVAKGAMVEAITANFAQEAITSDYGAVGTSTQQEMVTKMEGFLGAIAEVNFDAKN